MIEPLIIEFEDGTRLALTHRPGGWVSLEARGALSPTVTAIEIAPEDVESVKAWLGKHDASRRAEAAKEAVAPRAEPVREPIKRRGHDGG